MSYIKNYFLAVLVFVIGFVVIELYLHNQETSMIVAALLAVLIVLKPQKYLRKLTTQKSLFSGLPDEAVERHRNLLLNEFIAGEVASHFTSDVFLKKEEKLIFDIPSIQLCEEKTIKVKGSHSGYSIRIMKGISYRFGAFESAPEKRIAVLDTGHFILTNKRLIFSGGKKSLDVSLSKIVSAKPVENGILIDRTAKQNVEYFMGLDNVRFNMTVSPRLENGEQWKEGKVKFMLNGFDVRKIIQGLIQA